jgi:hypothetical protein
MDDQTPRRLFHALVLMGAALTGGAAACRSENTSEPPDATADGDLDAPPRYYQDIYVVDDAGDAPLCCYTVGCSCADTGIEADVDAQDVDARDVYGNISTDVYSWEASDAPTGDDAADGG